MHGIIGLLKDIKGSSILAGIAKKYTYNFVHKEVLNNIMESYNIGEFHADNYNSLYLDVDIPSTYLQYLFKLYKISKPISLIKLLRYMKENNMLALIINSIDDKPDNPITLYIENYNNPEFLENMKVSNVFLYKLQDNVIQYFEDAVLYDSNLINIIKKNLKFIIDINKSSELRTFYDIFESDENLWYTVINAHSILFQSSLIPAFVNLIIKVQIYENYRFSIGYKYAFPMSHGQLSVGDRLCYGDYFSEPYNLKFLKLINLNSAYKMFASYCTFKELVDNISLRDYFDDDVAEKLYDIEVILLNLFNQYHVLKLLEF